jgi:ADP-ribose pyrophosphatase
MTTTYETLDTKTVYQGKIFSVRQDQVSMPDGTNARRDVVIKDGAVAIVALNERDQVALIRQYRHPMGEYLWELPAGLLDTVGATPLETAQRELVEEVGYRATIWKPLVTIAASPGFTNERTQIFLAAGLNWVGRPEAHAEEADLELRWFDLSEALRWVREGQIINAHSVAGIQAAAINLGVK